MTTALGKGCTVLANAAEMVRKKEAMGGARDVSTAWKPCHCGMATPRAATSGAVETDAIEVPTTMAVPENLFLQKSVHRDQRSETRAKRCHTKPTNRALLSWKGHSELTVTETTAHSKQDTYQAMVHR